MMKDYTKKFTDKKIVARLQGLGQKKLGVLFIIAGIVILMLLVALKRPPKKSPVEKPVPLVKAIELKAQDAQMIIKGFGTVKPKVEIEISPQVSGKIIWVNPEFKPGGFIKAGETIVTIDPNDYVLAVEQAQAGVAEANVALVTERAEAEAAKREWYQLHPNQEPTSPLVFREPQVRQAEARVKSAQATLSVAELALDRTKITVPIDIRVDSESTDLGQFVTVGKMLGTAYGTKVVEILLPLEDKEIRWFNIPEKPINFNGGKLPDNISKALVTAKFAGSEHIWEGYVVRTVGRIDERSRMISVVIEVPRPFDETRGKESLLPGMFVKVEILGKRLNNVIAIPREALHNNNELWAVNDGHLKTISPEIARFGDDYAYVTSDVNDGTIIITSPLDMPINGMKVNVEMEQSGMDASVDSTETE